MTSSPITSWKIDGETVETVSDFNFLGSKITAGGDCSHEIKRRLLLGRTVMTNLDIVLWPIFWLGRLFFWNWAAGVACLFLRLVICQLLHLLLFSPILKAVTCTACYALAWTRLSSGIQASRDLGANITNPACALVPGVPAQASFLECSLLGTQVIYM